MLQEPVYKTKINDVHELTECTLENGIRWISASLTKSLESG